MLNSVKNFFKGSAKTLITGTGAIASALLKPLSIPFEAASNILKWSVGNFVHKVSKTLVETFKTAKDSYKTISSKNRPWLLKYPTAITSLLLGTTFWWIAHGANNTLGFAADAVKSTIAIPQSSYRHIMDTANALQWALTMATDPNGKTTANYYKGMTWDIGKTLKKNYFSDLGMKSIGINKVDTFFWLWSWTFTESKSDEKKEDPTPTSEEKEKEKKNNENSHNEKKIKDELDKINKTHNEEMKWLKEKIDNLTESIRQQQEMIKQAQDQAEKASNSTPTQSKESKEAIDALHEKIQTSTETIAKMEESLQKATEKADQTLQAIQAWQQNTDDIKNATDNLTQTIKDLQDKLDQQKTDLENKISDVEEKININP